MGMVDAFAGDTFKTVSLTNSLNKLPFRPSRIAQMGLFEDKPVRNRTVVLEEIAGSLQLLDTQPWGAPATIGKSDKRAARSFNVPHIPHEDIVFAADVQDIRAFGSESQEQGVVQVVNDKLAVMKQRHEVTLEHLRAGAITGSILDADGSTELYNLFTEFGISETNIDFVLGTATTDIKEKCLIVKAATEDALGAAVYDHMHCFAGQTWYRSFIKHAKVTAAFDRYQSGEFLRQDVRFKGFDFAGIVFEEYRGTIGGVAFIPATEARFFPVGVPQLFITCFAPADFVEAVNTMGQQYYAKQKLMDFDRGIRLHTQSNPLPLCTIPGVLVKGSTSN